MTDFSRISTFIFDVDGVLTDGSIITFATGEHARNFYIKDGYAIEKALRAGFQIIIITGGFEEGVEKRLRFLGIKDVFMGVKNKVEVFHQFTENKKIDPSRILYMGDDIPDLKMLKLVGIPSCPADAVEDVKKQCAYISPFNGGRGAVRDVIEQVMKVQSKWLPENW